MCVFNNDIRYKIEDIWKNLIKIFDEKEIKFVNLDC